MIKMSQSRRELWNPRKRDIVQAKAACVCPPDVQISKLPRDADLNTGTGIRDGALVLSPSHLKYIRFPLHPLFHVVWSALDLHPMQLNPNSYLQLSAFLALGLQVGVSIDPSDFFHFHDCVPIREEVEYFHFASKPNFKSFVNKPSSHKKWKHRPLLVTGNWAAPELKFLKIPSTFAVSAASFTTIPIPERIQWLKTYLAGSCLDIKTYSTPAILRQISQERSSIIYSHFLPTHLKLKPGLEGKELARHIVESLASMDATISESPEHVAERERTRERVEKRNRSGGETDEAVNLSEDPDVVDLDQVDELTMVPELPPLIDSLPSKPSKLEKKRSGSSALRGNKRLKTVLNHSSHSSGMCLEPSLPTFPPPKSIPLNKKKNAALERGLTTDLASGQSSCCWMPKFKKEDGSYVTEEEKLVGNPDACLAVCQGLFHPADASASQKEAPQEIMKATASRFIELGQMVMATQHLLTRSGQNEKFLTAMNETKDKQLEVLKAELEQERQRARELESQLRAELDLIKEVQGDLSKLKEELRKENCTCKIECQNAEKKDFMDLASSRFGRVQSSLPPDNRFVANPDVLDAQHGLRPEPGDYVYFHGMKPSDHRFEGDSRNKDDQENNNETEYEVEQDKEDDPKDEDDEDEEDDPKDEDDEDEEDYHDEDVEIFFGIKDVDNNLDLSMHPPNSNMIQFETSPSRTYLSLRSNQETSNTTLQLTSPVFRPEKFTHANPIHIGLLSVPPIYVHVPGVSPIEGVIKLNTAAPEMYSTKNRNKQTAGGVIRSDAGSWCKGYAICVEYADSVIEAELQSIWIGLHLAWNGGYRSIEVETNSFLSYFLRLPSSDDGISQKQRDKRLSLVRKITEMETRLSFKIRSINLEQNMLAYKLAILGEDLPEGRFVVFDYPPELSSLGRSESSDFCSAGVAPISHSAYLESIQRHLLSSDQNN